METVCIEGVEIALAHPDEFPLDWKGRKDLLDQLLAAWLVVEKGDLPLLSLIHISEPTRPY